MKQPASSLVNELVFNNDLNFEHMVDMPTSSSKNKLSSPDN